MSNYKKFTDQERQFLDQFKSTAEAEERHQTTDLIQNCTNKHEFAKTFGMYEKDWMKTRSHMEAQAEQGGKLSREVLHEMISIGDKLMQEKQSKLIHHFQFTWHESIFNYLGGRPSIESLQKAMKYEENKKEPTVESSSSSDTNPWPYILAFVIFLLLVVLPAVSRQLPT